MKKNQIRKMAQLAILIAIMLIFAFTPLGYFKTAGVEITFMVLPVAIGAIVIGPAGGAILGGVFGITSFVQCFGTSPFGAMLLGINPIFTFITCLVPRVLCGWIAGWIFRALQKVDKTKLVSYCTAALSTALLNTVFFILSIVVFFWKNETFTTTMISWGFSLDSFWVFVVAFVGLNGLIEAIVNFVVAAAVGKAVVRYVDKAE